MNYRKFKINKDKSEQVCPDCGEPDFIPHPAICTCPTMIVIQPGTHIHVDCPQHGHVVLRGPNITWMSAQPKNAAIEEANDRANRSLYIPKCYW